MKKIVTILIGCCICFLFSQTVFAASSYPLNWSPETIELTIARGEIKEVDVSFVSSKNMKNVDLWVVPELQPYIKLAQSHFDYITAGVANSVHLTYSATCDNMIGTHQGTLHLRSNRTYPQTLKIVLNIVNPVPTTGTHIVTFAMADPDGIFINNKALVTVSAQIVPDPALLFENIHLLMINEAGQIIGDLGRLYDDGTHGDVLAGDSTFTTQISFNEQTAGQRKFIISIPYSDTVCPILSDIIVLNILEPLNAEEVNNILSVNQAASDNLKNWTQQYGINVARNMLLQYLLNQPVVANAGISQDSETIWIVYINGLEGIILANPPDTWGYPSSNKGIVFSPVSSLAESELTHVYNRLDNDTCVSPDPIRRDGEVTVDFLKTIYQYGVISMATHGGVDGSGNVVFMTGEKASTFLGIPTSHIIDWITGRIVIGSDNHWLIRPSFISHYATNHRYPDSIIFLSMCHSLDNNTLSNAFISRGAATIFGWQHSVSVTFARQTKENLLVQMIDNKKTTGGAFNAVPKQDPFTTPNAILLMAGKNDMKLPVNLVVNGSFETGDLSGWTGSFLYGCDFPFYGTPSGYRTVIAGNATDGTYSARLGRWDQIFTGGLYGPPSPGTEPCGYDYIYQDIDIPSGSGLTLSFSYNIQTYDTAVWDWFDVFIKDPLTGSNLASVVSEDGKPGYDYGVYWNGGIKNVTHDLTPFAGKTIRLWFGNRQDGWGDQSAVWIDNVGVRCQ